MSTSEEFLSTAHTTHDVDAALLERWVGWWGLISPKKQRLVLGFPSASTEPALNLLSFWSMMWHGGQGPWPHCTHVQVDESGSSLLPAAPHQDGISSSVMWRTLLQGSQ